MHEWEGPTKSFCSKCGCMFVGFDRKDPCPGERKKEKKED